MNGDVATRRRSRFSGIDTPGYFNLTGRYPRAVADLWTEALAILRRGDECLDHLGVDEVAVESIQFRIILRSSEFVFANWIRNRATSRGIVCYCN